MPLVKSLFLKASLKSPKLLMLSGIGSASELTKHGIEVIVDSRHVGQHFLDHSGVPFVLQLKDGFGLDDYLIHDGPRKEATVFTYNKGNEGLMGFDFPELVILPCIDNYLKKDSEYRRSKANNGDVDPFSPEGQPHFELDFVCMFGSTFQ